MAEATPLTSEQFDEVRDYELDNIKKLVYHSNENVIHATPVPFDHMHPNNVGSAIPEDLQSNPGDEFIAINAEHVMFGATGGEKTREVMIAAENLETWDKRLLVEFDADSPSIPNLRFTTTHENLVAVLTLHDSPHIY